jgi:hypothetical protein
VAVSCEHNDEPSGCIKCGEFLEYMSDCFWNRNVLHGVNYTHCAVPRYEGRVVKVKLSLCLTKRNAMKTYILLNPTSQIF